MPCGAGGVRQRHHLHCAEPFQLLRIDDRRKRRERNRAARVARSTAARDYRQAELNARAHERRNLALRIGREHEKGIFDAPIRRIGDVRHACERIEADIVLARIANEQAAGTLTKIDHPLELALERLHRSARRLQQLADLAIALAIRRVAPSLHFVQSMMQRLDQHAPAFRVVDQVILQVRIALDDPDIAEHLVEHAGRTARAALAPQLVEDLPDGLAEQPHHDLAIRERGVVVRNFTQTCGRVRNERVFRLDRLERKGQIEQDGDLGFDEDSVVNCK